MAMESAPRRSADNCGQLDHVWQRDANGMGIEGNWREMEMGEKWDENENGRKTVDKKRRFGWTLRPDDAPCCSFFWVKVVEKRKPRPFFFAFSPEIFTRVDDDLF